MDDGRHRVAPVSARLDVIEPSAPITLEYKGTKALPAGTWVLDYSIKIRRGKERAFSAGLDEGDAAAAVAESRI
ncbi:hypothetical protein HYPSUDRAFT_70558 [Hypholoma sublateritium FD-334 SS-4]|uniref:Uncharacterized protein n=1 Tax=Hypholoma sublateritium (strain FD-334 SS-4) TaxID=945553 RepID=A0A0D2NM17_HYPSF|nr:hypothetical protein HYPSUDRAFT_70558 [Hypholoma sublateritium FD-334 SS-4]